MKPLLLSLLLTLAYSPTFAQSKVGQARLDSLLAQLPRTRPDTIRVSLLNEISYSYYRSNPNEGLNYANQALTLANQWSWKRGMADAYNWLGASYGAKADYPKALTSFLSGLKIAEELNDKNRISSLSGNMGTVYFGLGDYAQALNYFEKSLTMMEEKLSNKIRQTTTLTNIGNVYGAQGHYFKAIDYYQKSLKLNETPGLIAIPKASTMSGIGTTYLRLGDIPKALDYLQKGLHLSKVERHKTSTATNYVNLSNLYFQLTTRLNAYLLPTLLGGTRADALHKANLYADSAVVLNKELGNLGLLYQAYYNLSNIQDALGEHQAAFATYKLYTTTKDQVFSQENNKKIAAASLQYEFDKKETALKFEQQLTAAQLQKQILLTKQQTQALSLKAQAAQLATKERDLQRLQYLQEKAAKQDKEKQLALSEKEKALKATALELSQAEVQNQNQQQMYLLAGVGSLATLLGLIVFGYAQKQKANTLLKEQKEEINKKSNLLEQSLAELKATQNQLIQKEKMASLGELTAGIAHEIQNPLNFVNNFSEVSTDLVDELSEGPLQHLPQSEQAYVAELLEDLTSNLKKITHHGQRASGIVKGMLEHSRASSGDVQPTDLNALANEYLRLAYHGQRTKDKDFACDLVTHFDSTIGQMSLMTQEMGRVLLNLYNNAFYAIRERQKQVGPDYQPTITVSTLRTKSGVEVRVIDNGTGMPQSVQDKIFQPFFTTKPTGEGTGLGLSLSYDIVTKGHNGSLTVASQEGAGTEFVITLSTSNQSARS